MTVERNDRRSFLKTTAATLTAAAIAPNAYAGGSDEIKVGLVGCGGRGSQACENVLDSAKGVRIVALGDVFKDKVYGLRSHLDGWIKQDGQAKKFGNVVDIHDDHCFDGLDAFKS